MADSEGDGSRLRLSEDPFLKELSMIGIKVANVLGRISVNVAERSKQCLLRSILMATDPQPATAGIKYNTVNCT